MSLSISRATWRVTALATPAWRNPCSSCRTPNARFTATDRFRVNASGVHLDVWLLYACEGCGATRKRSLLRRTPVAAIAPVRLDAYHRNDPAVAWAHAFEIAAAEAVPYRLERPPLPVSGVLFATIEQPHPCGVRWDRLLASELGRSRTAVRRDFRDGAIAIDGVASLVARVADAQQLSVDLGPDPKLTAAATLPR